MPSVAHLAAFGAVLSAAAAEYVASPPPFPTTATNGYPIGTGYPTGTGIAHPTGTGVGTIGPIVTGTGTTGPISTGTPSVPRAGNVYFINQCPYPLYISTNVTSARKPFELGGTYTQGQGEFSFEFELLNPAQTYSSGPQPTDPVSSLAPTASGIAARKAPHWRNPRGHQWNETATLGVDIEISRAAADTGLTGPEGHILYYAHEGTYDYEMRAPEHFLTGRSQVDPVGEVCEATDGWTGEKKSCSWGADMWITFCADYTIHG